MKAKTKTEQFILAVFLAFKTDVEDTEVVRNWKYHSKKSYICTYIYTHIHHTHEYIYILCVCECVCVWFYWSWPSISASHGSSRHVGCWVLLLCCWSRRTQSGWRWRASCWGTYTNTYCIWAKIAVGGNREKLQHQQRKNIQHKSFSPEIEACGFCYPSFGVEWAHQEPGYTHD